MSVTHLNQVELAARWKISPRTLERWRWTGEGPAFIKIGGRVVYAIADLQAWADRGARTSTDIAGAHPVLPARRPDRA